MIAWQKMLFLFYVYSGVRSAYNRARCIFLQKPNLATLDGHSILLNGYDAATIRVHARSTPKAVRQATSAGMISVFLHSPGIWRWTYAMLRLTSHFGCGHIEIAFYEDRNTVVFFAIRNMLQANINRLGCRRVFARLKLSNHRDEVQVLQQVVNLLNDRGIVFSFATPDDCVKLAVLPDLLAPNQLDRIADAIWGTWLKVWINSCMHLTPGI